MGKIEDFKMADLSTATISTVLDSASSILLDNGKPKNGIVHSNPQLYLWKRAKEEYNKAKSAGRNLYHDESIFIIILLGNSLAFLFGRSWEGGDGINTPSLKNLVEKKLPTIGIDLESDDQELYSHFDELNQFYNDCTKHHDMSKENKIEELNNDRVEKFLETTRCVWIWYLRKKLNQESHMEDKAFSEFKDKYWDLDTNGNYSSLVDSN